MIKWWLLKSFKEFNELNFNPYEERIKNLVIDEETGDYTLPYLNGEDWVKKSVEFHLSNGLKEGIEEAQWYVKRHNLYIPCILTGSCSEHCYIYQQNCSLYKD